MTEAAKGIDQILLYRILSEAGLNAAAKLAFQTEHETTESKDSESVPTKDGNINVPGQLETEISGTSILAKGDAMVKKLRNAMRNDEIVEVWEIDKGSAVPGALEVATLTISGAPSTAGEITITLNGVAEKVVVLSTDTAAIVGDRIRNTNVAGWTVGGSGATVTFTKTRMAPTLLQHSQQALPAQQAHSLSLLQERQQAENMKLPTTKDISRNTASLLAQKIT